MEAIIGIVVGALLTQISQYIEHRRQRQVKADDRAAAREDEAEKRRQGADDEHRTELRHAYASLMATHARYLDTGTQLLASLRTVEGLQEGVRILSLQAVYGDKQREDYQRGLTNQAQWNERVRSQTAAFVAALTEVQTKLADVVLLENDPERQSLLGVVAELTVKLPQSPDDYVRFESDVEKSRARLASFKWTLAGVFAPRHQAALAPANVAPPIAPTPAQSQIKSTSPPQLSDGSIQPPDGQRPPSETKPSETKPSKD